MDISRVRDVTRTCAKWHYLRGVELTDQDKELFGLCTAHQVMNGVPISISALDTLFSYLRDLGLFESTYELADNTLPTDEQLVQIEADLTRWAAEQQKQGITWRLARRNGAGIPIYEQVEKR